MILRFRSVLILIFQIREEIVPLKEYIKRFDQHITVQKKSQKGRKRGFLQLFIDASPHLPSAFQCLKESLDCCIKSHNEALVLNQLSLDKDTDIIECVQATYINKKKGVDCEIIAENIVFSLLSCHYSVKISLVSEKVNRLCIRCFKPGEHLSEIVLLCSLRKYFKAVLQTPMITGNDTSCTNAVGTPKIKRGKTGHMDLNKNAHVSSLHGYGQYNKSRTNLAMPFFESFLSQCEASINIL